MANKEQVNSEHLPEHIAVIMDGNGRWAKEKGNKRIFGHKNGVKSVREVTEAAAEIGVPYLTLYAFSKENWERPKSEVSSLMSLLVETLHGESKTLMKNGVRLGVIGDIESLPDKVVRELNK
ncbi:MAG: polyprenyl diphosphate synthase, partial [Bacteroidota bacterium]